jgi:hypothetical protein
MSELMLEGGCLCGAVRYRARGPALGVEYCHCGMCRRAAGAPTVCWADFPREAFTILRGEPSQYASSEHARRAFCRDCGTQLTFSWEGRPYLSLTVGSLDEPERLAPRQHIYEADRLPWLHIGDDLPRYPADAPPGETPEGQPETQT